MGNCCCGKDKESNMSEVMAHNSKKVGGERKHTWGDKKVFNGLFDL